MYPAHLHPYDYFWSSVTNAIVHDEAGEGMLWLKKIIASWACLHLAISVVHSANILGIFPMAAKSHFSCNEAIMNSLREAGHKITFVSPFPDHESMQNYTVIDSRQNTFIYIGQTSLNDFKHMSYRQSMYLILTIEAKYCEDVLRLPQVQEMLNSTFIHQYDIMFIEMITMGECFLPLAEKLNIPVIGTVTLRSGYIADMSIGNSYLPSVIPNVLTSFNDKMTFYQRFVNFFCYIYNEYYHRYIIPSKLDQINHQYYPVELWNKKKISLIFVNNHVSIFPRTLVPNAIEVGGIHLKPVKPLPEKLQKFIDEAKHGVILFTFGSVMKSSTMPMEMKIAFKEAFARISQRVIWKFEEKIDGLSDNVMLINWVPQRDILAHENVKAFISHCGISGSYESVYEGVPMILTPLFNDQMSNAAFLEKVGVGVLLDVYTATTNKILNALNAVINDTKYYKNMQELSRLFKDRPLSPKETIVYWTEYVIRTRGAMHLRTTSADMPTYQYFLVDIILAIALGVSLLILIVIYPLKSIYKFCFTNTPHETSVKIDTKKKL